MQYHQRVRLDRYAIKDSDRDLNAGDLVVASVERTFDREARRVESREIGSVVQQREDGTYDVRIDNEEKEIVESIPRHRLEYVVEKTYEEICRRVAKAVAVGELEFEHKIYDLMEQERFIAAGRILAGLGRPDFTLTLFNCFVFNPTGDSRAAITKHWGRLFETYARGGGVGTPLSILRPRGSIVRKVMGRSSGSVSWAEQFSQITGATEQAGSRRGALMLCQWCWHPDTPELIQVKAEREEFKTKSGEIVSRNKKLLNHANVSIMLTNDFMKAVENDGDWDLVFPDLDDPDYDAEWDGDLWRWRDELGKAVVTYQTIKARDLWNQIIQRAWESGEPGVIFMERANDLSNSYYYAPLCGTNPCSEQVLPASGVCNLGHLNLAKFVLKEDQFPEEERTHTAAYKQIDWDGLTTAIHAGIRFLDNTTDLNQYHDEAVEERQTAERRIGLGLLGYGEMLLRLGLQYGSDEAIKFTDRVMKHLSTQSYLASVELAKERGSFPAFDADKFLKSGFMRKHTKAVKEAVEAHGIRNVTVNTIAPTGSVAALLRTSSGCEPFFELEYTSTTRIGIVTERPPVGDEIAAKFGTDRTKWPSYVVTAQNGITPEQHVRTQGTMQRWIDSAISKCIAAGTLIPTDKGLIPVEAFAGDHEPDTFAPTDGGFRTGGHKILSHYRAGEKSATRIRLDNGAELVGSTESHRVRTPEGWRLMAELKSGDFVVGRFQESHGSGAMPLGWTDNLNTNANAVKTPKHMTPAFARFLGMVASDGCTVEATGRVDITCKNDRVAEVFRKTCQEVFGILPNEITDARNGVLSLYITSRNLVRFVESLISKGAYNKHAPIAVLQGSYDEKLAFLEGVTLDGYVTPQGLVVYEGMSKNLAYHVAELARSFGMPRVNQGSKWVAVSSAYTHSVAVSNEMQEIITPIEPHKQVDATYKRFKVLADVNSVERSRFDSRSTEYYALRSAQDRGNRYVFNTTAKALGIPADTPVHKVTDVEDAGVLELYDVEVEEAHEYVVNGMVSHNTINLPNSATTEDVAAAYQMMWDMKCKGGTVYRDGSRDEQVLYLNKPEEVKEGTVEVVEDRSGLGIIQPRPDVGYAVTFSEESPIGTVHATMRHDPQTGVPVDFFVSLGKGDSSADAEALGRLISMILRFPNNQYVNQQARLEIVRGQLSDILGRGVVGFGTKQKRSLPDTIAKIIERYLAADFPMAHVPYGFDPMKELLDDLRRAGGDREAFDKIAAEVLYGKINGDSENTVEEYQEKMKAEVEQAETDGVKLPCDYCPDCGNHTLVTIPGKCPYCRNCGHTRC